MSRWLLALPLLFFGVIGIGLYVLVIGPAGDEAFRENMVPELIGFCLEGFFLVGLLAFVQQLREQQRKRELRLSLRGALRDFLSHLDLAYLEMDAEPASTRDLENDPAVVHRLMRRLQEKELDADSMVELKRVAIYTLPLVQDLIDVAASLSPGHMRWWIAIVEAIKRLAQAGTREEVEQPLYLMLLNLSEFDAVNL
jgi:hypothetical protein